MDLVRFLDEEVYPRLDLMEVFAPLEPQDCVTYIKARCPACGKRPAFAYKDKPWLSCSHRSCQYSVSVLAWVNGGSAPHGEEFVETVRMLARMAGVPLDVPPSSDELEAVIVSALQSRAPSRPAAPLAPSVAVPGTEGFASVIGRDVRAYARKRGVTDGEAAAYRLGHAVAVQSRPESQEYRGRFLVLPVLHAGEVVSWQARDTKQDAARKYLSHADIKNWLWPLDAEALSDFRRSGEAIVVEGWFDALALRRKRRPGVTCFGKSISQAQVDLLCAAGVKSVTVALDLDASQDHRTGRLDTLSSVEKLVELLASRMNVRVADLSPPEGRAGKVDFGDALLSDEISEWMCGCVDGAIDVGSSDWMAWRVARLVG